MFDSEPQTGAAELKHTRFCRLAAPLPARGRRIWATQGRTGVGYSDHKGKGLFEGFMDRLRRITPRAQDYAPVMRCAGTNDFQAGRGECELSGG